MKKIKIAALLLAASVQLVRAEGGSGSRLAYPETRKSGVVDNYFGTAVADPYRWLEDDNAPEVAAWVEAENKVTFDYLDKIAYRPQLKERLTRLLNYPKYSVPARRGENFFFSKNEGLQKPERPVHPERSGRPSGTLARSQ
jgi:prolyl oligopeptidase